MDVVHFQGTLYYLMVLCIEIYGQSRCPYGTFGDNCQLSCHCATTQDCQGNWPFSGSCESGLCDTGWTGATCQIRDIARNKIATQSTIRSPDWAAENAVDGSPDTCTHTRYGRSGSWWQLDLGAQHLVYNFKVWNMEACCEERINNIHISVSENSGSSTPSEACYVFPNVTNSPPIITTPQCRTPLYGRFVRFLHISIGTVTLCEVKIYECSDFTFGDDCTKQCNCDKRDEICHKWNGSCQSGCPVGYGQTTDCQTECTIPEFGYDCTTTCHCRDLNDRCTNTWTCNSGCADGYLPTNCSTKCDSGTFGASCLPECNCVSSTEACDHVTGNCSISGCKAGFTGINCLSDCLVGTYGSSCPGVCNCENDTEVCDKTSGACPLSGCARGWKGIDCNTECDDGTFGYQCVGTCHCNSTEVCDKVIGSCASGCATGWSTDNCSECDRLTFGQGCNSTCHCRDSSEECGHIDGTCVSGCPDGFTGVNCLQKCVPGKFGENCSNICNCKESGDICDRISGACRQCADGFNGIDCRSVTSSPDVMPIVVGVLAGLLLIAIVLGLVFYIKRRRHNDSTQDMPISIREAPSVKTNDMLAAVVDDGNGTENDVPEESIYNEIVAYVNTEINPDDHTYEMGPHTAESGRPYAGITITK